ncbi:MAG: DUF488 domain-containing protein [Gammaproteobacteria bacterium]|jgi:uncharacterized protein YeaO (DUF488 family)|nr:DUF488 domain-containing protein [Gammaproteobacteria bacterium]
MRIRLKRAYEAPARSDGQRILVDRLWPRGLTRDKAAVDHWIKEVAPSSELRKWFGHDPERWPEFRRRYRAELKKNPALAELRALARKGSITLLYSAKDEQHNQAVVLKQVLDGGA